MGSLACILISFNEYWGRPTLGRHLYPKSWRLGEDEQREWEECVVWRGNVMFKVTQQKWKMQYGWSGARRRVDRGSTNMFLENNNYLPNSFCICIWNVLSECGCFLFIIQNPPTVSPPFLTTMAMSFYHFIMFFTIFIISETIFLFICFLVYYLSFFNRT